jgi:hypothetical protein
MQSSEQIRELFSVVGWPNALEISDIQEAKLRSHWRGDHDLTMLHRAENRAMGFLRTTGSRMESFVTTMVARHWLTVEHSK